MPQSKQTVCLNMIVRNEAPIIERCLRSVENFVDHWVIVDTGSTDGTQQIVRQCLRHLPGVLIERPWVDFAHNRTEALTYAQGRSDYILVIDADELLVIDREFSWPHLTHDAYYLKIFSRPVSFWRLQLFRNADGWRYESSIHEYLRGPDSATFDRLEGIWIESRTDGARAAEPGVFQNDVAKLLRAYHESPEDTRTVFYLAQSYAAAGEFERALEFYEKRVQLGGWPEEVWCALFQAAEVKSRMERDWSEVLQAYLNAYQLRPTRAEPLYRVAVKLRWQGDFQLAQMFLEQAAAIAYPHEDYLFVEEHLYHYAIKMALATCCYHVGQYEAGLRHCDELLTDRDKLPANIYEQVMLNRQQCAAKAAEDYARSGEFRPTLTVFALYRDDGPNLDNGIDQLLRQTCVPLQIIFVDLGAGGDESAKIPLDLPNVSLVKLTEIGTQAGSFLEFVADKCGENDIVLILDGHDWLASDDILAQLQQYFADPNCLVTYGQFQYADGQAGLASSISDLEAERILLDDWRSTYPLAFRGSQLRKIIEDDPEFARTAFFPSNAPPASSPVHQQAELARRLFATVGVAGIRYNPHPICVYDADRSLELGPNGDRPVASSGRYPLISCLTVTKDRLVLLKEAIRCYCRQTYPNRELVIVTDGLPRFRRAIEDHLQQLGRTDIRLVCVDEPDQTLGTLRNISLDSARGELVCQWDDDDLNHPERLERQFEHLRRTKASGCCFSDQLQFFFKARTLFWSNWRVEDAPATEQLIPGTLMAHRDRRFRYPESGAYSASGEDSVLLEQIAELGSISRFEDAGFLNIYSYHGRNVFPEFHHHRIAMLGGRSLDFLREKEAALRDALRQYRLPKPYEVTMGNGMIFYIEN